MSEGLNAMSARLEALTLSASASLLNDGVQNVVERAFELSMPYVPDEQRQECEELVPRLGQEKERRISVDALFRIFGALMTLLHLLFRLFRTHSNP